jgi:hypothetical protein
MASPIQLNLTLGEAHASPERLDTLTVHLMRDLRDLGADSVARRRQEEAPAGAKSVESFALVAQC